MIVLTNGFPKKRGAKKRDSFAAMDKSFKCRVKVKSHVDQPLKNYHDFCHDGLCFPCVDYFLYPPPLTGGFGFSSSEGVNG